MNVPVSTYALSGLSRASGNALRLCALIAVVSVCAVPDVLARETALLEEVVVTARKRDESLQDVPMAVSAFDTQALVDNQIDNIVDLQIAVPNITLNETSGLVAGALQVFIRGVGNDPGFDQGVGIYVDDVYLNRASGALLEVYDVARVEVLKGPQGHLYGRNTIGGAIKYISQEPGDELAAGLTLKVGTDDLVKLKGNVSGPLVDDTLFGGFAFVYTERDGYQTNRYDGGEWAAREALAFRGTLLWRATDALSFKLISDYNKDQGAPTIPNRTAINALGISAIDNRLYGANDIYGPGTGIVDERADLSLPANVDEVNTANLFPGFNAAEIETWSLAGSVSWDINDSWTVKSVTAQRTVEAARAFDFDGSDQIFIDSISQPDSVDLSQEIQVNYSARTLAAVFGLYYLDGSAEISSPGISDQRTRIRLFDDYYKATYADDRDLESISVYANIDWEFAPDWQLSFGGRYTKDDKTLTQLSVVEQSFYAFALTDTPQGKDLLGITPGMEAFVESQPQFVNWVNSISAQRLIDREIGEQPPLDSARISRFFQVSYDENLSNQDEWSEFTPSIRLSHHWNDDTLLYGAYASGFKSGGFATDGSIAAPYKPETLDSYTAGIKTMLAGGTLRLNAEVFYNEYFDKQLTTVSQTAVDALRASRANVGEVESRGFEVELTWLMPLPGVTLNMMVGYLDSEITQFLVDDDERAIGLSDNAVIDISDVRRLGYQPEWTAGARISHNSNIAGLGRLHLSANVAFRDEMFTDSPVDISDVFLARSISDAMTTYNAMIAFSSRNDNWRVVLEGKNLSDERELVNTFNVASFITGGYNRGRTWAFSVSYIY